MRVWIDMDGVLADFEGGVTHALGMGSRDYRQLHGDKVFWRALSKVPEFHVTLPLALGARQLWDAIEGLRPRPAIVAHCVEPWQERQKRDWALDKFGKRAAVVSPEYRRVWELCGADDVLVSNDEDLRRDWVRAGGRFIGSRAGYLAVLSDLEEAGVFPDGAPAAEATDEPEPEYVYRSAATGRFVSEAFAAANPDTTYRTAA